MRQLRSIGNLQYHFLSHIAWHDVSAQMNFFSSVYVELILEESPGLLQESSGMLRKSPMMLHGSSMILEGSPGMLEVSPETLEDCLRCYRHHL